MFLVQHAGDVIQSELGIQVEELEPGETEPQPQPRERRLDRAFLAWLGIFRRYIHFEVQHAVSKHMAYRIMEYAVRLMCSRKNPEEWWPVLSIVLWVSKVANIPEPPLRIKIADGMEIVYPFVNIKVFEWSKEKLQTDLPGILILAPLVRDVTLEDLEIYAQRLYNITKEDEREQAGALFFTFVEEQYYTKQNWSEIQQHVSQMLRKVGFGMDVIDEMIQHTHVYQHGIAQAVAVAEKQGEARGEARGEAKEAAKMLRRQWIKKYGSLDSDADVALLTASIEAIERVLDQLIDPSYTLTQARSDLGL